jgi:heat shock protein HslJ
MSVSRLLIAVQLVASCFLLVMPASTNAQDPSSGAGNRLADTEWTLTSFGVGNAVSPVVEGTTVTLKFGSDGRAGGSSGCNTYGSDYRVSGNTVSFGAIFSTKRACLDRRANQQEQRFFRALESARTFRLSGNRLTIFHDGGQNSLNFVNSSPAPPPQDQNEDLTNPVALLASFYDAINSRDHNRAYRYWETPPSRYEDFVRGYRDTVNVQLIVQPPSRFDGAAGSLYAEVPTVIIARQRNGTERMFAGCYVTRRSNQGAADGVWRIYRGSLSPAAARAPIPRLLARACN